MQDIRELLEWLSNTIITGREEGDDEGDEGDEGDDGEDNGEEGEGEGGEGDTGDGETDYEARAKALEESLKRERKLRRTAEREARKAKKTTATKEEKDTSEDLQKQLLAQEEKTQKLATRLRTSAIDTAILEAARDAGFIDPSDALTDEVRRQVDIDQDDEDPSDIDVDEDTVIEAVKKLAAKKKHLVTPAGGGEPSGGKFRKKGQTQDKASDQVLQEHYPSLR
jgi:hypothetical protein